MKLNFDKTLINFSKIFKEAGFSCYLVGGALRNVYAGLPVSDYDFATNALPEDVIKLFKCVIPTGIQHGTVTVLYKQNKIEVTTFRTDGSYSDLRHPDKIDFTSNIYEDLKRRDFTINSLAYDLLSNELIDPHDGKKDIKNKKIRAIGDATERFQEDALRIMRACRFSSQLNFEIEEKTLIGMKENAENLKVVSAERIRDEFNKILTSDKPSIALKIMDKTKIIKILFPELELCKKIPQKSFHNFDVFYHCIYSCDGAPKDNIVVRLAAIFHDVGKPVTLEYDEEGIPTFYKHEAFSAEICRKIMNKLKYSKSLVKDVEHLISNHMFNYLPEWKDSSVRRFIAKVGIDKLENLFLLRRADNYGMQNKMAYSANLIEFQERIKKIIDNDSAFCIKDLKINGNDLIFSAKIPKGPAIGIVLNFLLEAVLDDPAQNEKETLLKLASNFYCQKLL